MPNSKPHCSVDYHEFNGDDLETKAHAVSSGIYSNDPPFTSPPVATKVAFDAVITTYHNALEAYKNGGLDQKGDYLVARTSLIAQMDETGHFVDALPGVNEDMIILAGFTPTKTGDSSAVIPEVPTDIEAETVSAGAIEASCGAVHGAAFIGAILVSKMPLPAGFGISNAGQLIIENDQPGPGPNVSAGPGTTVVIFDLTKSRKKLFTGLAKGTEYYIYFYAGNSAGVSQLSEPKIIMCSK